MPLTMQTESYTLRNPRFQVNAAKVRRIMLPLNLGRMRITLSLVATVGTAFTAAS